MTNLRPPFTYKDVVYVAKPAIHEKGDAGYEACRGCVFDNGNPKRKGGCQALFDSGSYCIGEVIWHIDSEKGLAQYVTAVLEKA